MLSNRPWLNKRVVSREQQNTGKSIAVAETRNAHQFIDACSSIRIARYGRKYAKLRFGHFHRSWTAFRAGPARKGFPTVVVSNSRYRGSTPNWRASIRRIAQCASNDRSRSCGRFRRPARTRSLVESGPKSPLAQSRFTVQTFRSILRKWYPFQWVHQGFRSVGLRVQRAYRLARLRLRPTSRVRKVAPIAGS